MQIEVLFFASARAAAGCDRTGLDLVAGATVAAARDQLIQLYPSIAPGSSTLRFAVNEEFASLESVLSDGDTLALIPPVSGG